MSTFSSLEASKRALLAQRFGLDVTGNNINNVNTPGYSRRTAVVSETDPLQREGQFIGTGAYVEKLRSYREEFFDREIRNNGSRLSGFIADEKTFQNIESILGEPSDTGLNEVTTSFFNSFDQLAIKPENVGQRQIVLDQTQTMVEQFHRISAQMTEARQETYNSMSLAVDKANVLIKEIGVLNKEISNSKASVQSEAQTYVDSREKKLEELSQLSGINTTYENDGSANVYLNGVNIITGSHANELKLNENLNPATGERTAILNLYNGSNDQTVQVTPTSGELANNLKHYNVTLDDKDSSGGFSVFKQLDDFANAIASKVNNLSINGYGLDDKGPNPPGTSFFSPTVGKATAANIEISADIKGKPRAMALSDKAGEAGNSAVARSIGRLNQDSNFIEGQKPAEFYAAYLGRIGALSQDATSGKDNLKLVGDQLSNQRESVIGVNMDEESINLIKFQKAFEAASRVVNVTNEMLTTIINLGK